MGFMRTTLTITFDYTVAVIAHIPKELDNREITMSGSYKDNTNVILITTIICLTIFFLPGYNEFHSTPTPSSHNDDDQEKASHTWHTQNAIK